MTKPKILIFEDSSFVTEIYLNKFKEAGFEVKTYAFPPDNLIEEVIKEKPDIISMGIIMPNIDGYQVTEMLKADSRVKDIPIIGFTNLGLKEDIDKGIKAGMTDYLITAHWMPDEYVRIIKDYLKNPQKYQKKYPAEKRQKQDQDKEPLIIDENRYQETIRRAEQGEILIGIEPAMARQFFTASISTKKIQEIIGEPLYFERYLVKIVWLLEPIFLFLSFIASMLFFKWYSVAIIILTLIIWAFLFSLSSTGKQRIVFPIIILLTGFLLAKLFWKYGVWFQFWIISLGVIYFIMKLKYWLSVYFARVLACRNYKFFSQFLDKIIFLKETNI